MYVYPSRCILQLPVAQQSPDCFRWIRSVDFGWPCDGKFRVAEVFVTVDVAENHARFWPSMHSLVLGAYFIHKVHPPLCPCHAVGLGIFVGK